MRHRRWPQALYAAGGLLALVATIGGLHLPMARTLLSQLAGLCPVETSPTVVAPLQRESVRHLRGDRPAPRHATVPLNLLRLSATAIDDWTRQQRLTCQAADGAFRSLRCASVPAAALDRRPTWPGATHDLVITMDQADRPIAVSVMARHLDAARGAAVLSAVRDQLDDSVGSATRSTGLITAAGLAQPFYGASAEYRFRDRVVKVAATNIPGSGVVVRELYLTSNEA